jgi:hypothetical protein
MKGIIMFSFFNFHQDKSEKIKKFTSILQRAKLNPTYDNNAAFFGFVLEISSDEFSKYMKLENALEIMMKQLEERIKNSDFQFKDYDYQQDLNSPELVRGRQSGMRMLLDCNHNLIMHWNAVK